MYIPYSRYIKATYQEKLANVLKMVDNDYRHVLSDPDNLVRMGTEEPEQYWNIVSSINNIAHINGIEYIYYVRQEGETFRFVFSSEETPDTPLNAIIGFAQIELQNKQEGNLPSSTWNNISQIHQSGRHLLGIINDI